MATPLTKVIRAVVAEHERVKKHEMEVIRLLNASLGPIGYRVMPTGAESDGQRVPMKAAWGGVKRLVCPHCGRRFGRPVHLGRHMSAAHKAKKAKARVRAKARKTAGKAANTAKRKAVQKAAAASKTVTKAAGGKAAKSGVKAAA